MRGTRIEILRGFGAALMMHPGDGRTSIRSENTEPFPTRSGIEPSQARRG
jgi:hypothetical protein